MGQDGSAFIAANVIRHYNGRADLHLRIDGVMKRQVLTYSPSAQWESAVVTWSGVLSAGTHEITVTSPQANVWGCGAEWGSLDIMAVEQSRGFLITLPCTVCPLPSTRYRTQRAHTM